MPQMDISQYSQADSPASPSLVPGNDSAAKTRGGYGRNTTESSERLSPIGLLLKMLPSSQTYLNSRESMPTLKQKDTKSGFSIYRLQMSEPRTSENEHLLLPTPCASFLTQKVRPLIPSEIAQKEGRKGHGTMLAGALSNPQIVDSLMRPMLPTPRASQDYKPVRELAPTESAGRHGITLCAALSNQDIVANYLPTPLQSDSKRMKVSNADLNRHSIGLPVAAAMLECGLKQLPTPLASRLNEPVRELKLKETLKRSDVQKTGTKRFGKMLSGALGMAYPSLIGRRIHPSFVEWMMAFPDQWTNPDCKLSAMQLCQNACFQSLKQSCGLNEVYDDAS